MVKYLSIPYISLAVLVVLFDISNRVLPVKTNSDSQENFIVPKFIETKISNNAKENLMDFVSKFEKANTSPKADKEVKKDAQIVSPIPYNQLITDNGHFTPVGIFSKDGQMFTVLKSVSEKKNKNQEKRTKKSTKIRNNYVQLGIGETIDNYTVTDISDYQIVLKDVAGESFTLNLFAKVK